MICADLRMQWCVGSSLSDTRLCARNITLLDGRSFQSSTTLIFPLSSSFSSLLFLIFGCIWVFLVLISTRSSLFRSPDTRSQYFEHFFIDTSQNLAFGYHNNDHRMPKSYNHMSRYYRGNIKCPLIDLMGTFFTKCQILNFQLEDKTWTPRASEVEEDILIVSLFSSLPICCAIAGKFNPNLCQFDSALHSGLDGIQLIDAILNFV